MSITAVWGPPHSGKTTVAIDLAHALADSGSSVLLLSPELYSELSARLNIQIARERSLAAVQKNTDVLKQVVHKLDDLLFVLAAPHDNDAFAEWLSPSAAKVLLEQAASDFDAVIVDCPSRAEDSLAAWAMRDAEHVLMMSGASSGASLWVSAYARAVNAVEDKTLHICAQVKETFNYTMLHELLDVTPEVWLPFLPDADQQAVLYRCGGKTGKAYARGIDEICRLIAGKEDEAK